MAYKVSHNINKFRECFKTVPKDILQWFPGHMGKGLKQMQQRLKLVDCVIEVHDARLYAYVALMPRIILVRHFSSIIEDCLNVVKIPLSGRNPNFQFTVSGAKPHILVLNKKDLADLSSKSAVEERLKQNDVNQVLYTNCKDQRDRGVKQIMPLATKLIATSDRFNRSEEKEFCIMVIGVPNVGKSSLINALRNKHLRKAGVAHVGAVAGITRSVQNRIKVSEEPLVYLLDTPGILTPNVPDVESGLRLALCASLQDHLVGEDVIADYLLYWLNKHNNFKYVELMGLEGPTDSIGTVLATGALKFGKTQKILNFDGMYVQRPDLLYAARYMIKSFRNGELGLFMMDKDRLSN